MMEIRTKKTSAVKPAEKTHRRSIPLTLLDRKRVFPHYNSTVYIYRSPANVTADQFTDALKDSLSKTLVHFYPMAGRYTLDANGIIEIDCNDEGAFFVEAETHFEIDQLGHLAPSPEMSVLLPNIDEARHFSSYPLLAVQVTYFKCGSVSVGVRGEHHSMDGSSAFHLIKSWSEVARGLEISLPPFIDRTVLLRPRDPPRPKFDHSEYSQYSCPLPTQIYNTKVSVLRLTKDQLDILKAPVANQTDDTRYSTFEILAAHIWKCVCKARGVGAEEETKLMFPVDARLNRWKPKLPLGFFGNAIFRCVPVSQAGDLDSKPLSYAGAKIHEALVRMDSEYLRSAIDQLALLPSDLSAAKIGPRFFCSPNFQITSWAKMGLNDADFGWGPPIYSGPGSIKYEKAYIFPSDHGGGDLSVAIALKPEYIDVFEKLFYDFEVKNE